MFKVGDRVYAESRGYNTQLIVRGFGVIVEVKDRSFYVIFDGDNFTNTVYINDPQYKYDVIRKLTKLEQALQ